MQQGQAIAIVPFTIDLYDAVMALWRRCEGVGLSDADSRESIAEYLRRNPGMSFVAVADGAIVGAILAGHDGRRGFLHHLAVDPGYRHRSLGRLLMRESLGALRAAGIAKCHGLVFKDNATGLAFWRSVGWTVREDVCVVSKTMESAADNA